MKSSIAKLAFALALVAAACGDRAKTDAKLDSSLARDLALANSQPAQPTFQDTAMAPAPAKASPLKSEEPAPVKKATAPKPKPKPPVQVAQTAPQPPQAAPPVVLPQNAPAPAAAPAPQHGQIAMGSAGVLTSGTKVCTSTNLAGDKLVATLNTPLSGSLGSEIPAGSTVVLEVASVQSGDKAENATITFRVRSIVVNDKTYTVAADAVPMSSLDRSKVQGADPNADKKKVAGGAIAGAILGQIIGHNTKGTIIGAAAGAAAGAAVAKAGEKWEACLPAGAQIRLKLNEALVLS